MPHAAKIGITGMPSVGKTQTVLKIIEKLEAKEVIVGGMVTEAIEEGGQRKGFHIQDWLTKQKDTLSHVDFDSEFRVGKYGVDLEVLEELGVTSIHRGIEDAEVVVVDEVGKMEMESENFCAAVKDALNSDKAMIMTLHKKSRNPLLQDIRRRDDIRILEVTPINRNLLPYKIEKLLEGDVL
ncbi:nucleotide kinase [Thermoplasmatales archaeon SW_10_69_26]|jgi:nucleoside-triphosphatase|nr:MAG: nucleotide kinase [Thermoplasmatales archaeon SW_10_69_26]